MSDTLFSEYESLGPLGEGGFAVVWKVRHIQLGYIRALKMQKDFIANEDDPKYKNFIKECKVLLRLGNGGHENIVRIAQPRLLGNRALVEMEYIEGEDLQTYIVETCRGIMPYKEVKELMIGVASALAYCHHDIYEFCFDPNVDSTQRKLPGGSTEFVPRGKDELVEKYKIVHNDIHSNNIRRRKYNGKYVLLDFGMSLSENSNINSSSRKKGDPKYKSPEKFDDDNKITEGSDIYSFGVLMYEALSGRVPFSSKLNDSFQSEIEIMQKHKYELPAPVESIRRMAFEKANKLSGIRTEWKKDYPDWVEEVIMKCLAKDPKTRYQNGKELFDEINTRLQEEGEGMSREEIQKLRKQNEDVIAENKKIQIVLDEILLKQTSGEAKEADSRAQRKADIETQSNPVNTSGLSANTDGFSANGSPHEQVSYLQAELDRAKTVSDIFFREKTSLQAEIEKTKFELDAQKKSNNDLLKKSEGEIKALRTDLLRVTDELITVKKKLEIETKKESSAALQQKLRQGRSNYRMRLGILLTISVCVVFALALYANRLREENKRLVGNTNGNIVIDSTASAATTAALPAVYADSASAGHPDGSSSPATTSPIGPAESASTVTAMLNDANRYYNDADYEKAFPIYDKYKDHVLFDDGYQNILAYMYENAQGTSRNLEEAFRLYNKSAQSGNKSAQYNLGRMYEDGHGITKDLYMALTWFRRSAAQGDASAECEIGYLFSNGLAVKQSYDSAVKWYGRAAEDGNATGQFNLAVMYEQGRGGNLAQAKYWYGRSAAQGNKSAIESCKRLGIPVPASSK